MSIKTFLKKIKSKVKYGCKLAAFGSNSQIGKDCIIQHPEHIFTGQNVSIGANTFIGPVTNYAGLRYNPKIEIGDNTIIGRNNSLAAINGIRIGRDVLFAGQVHITDHSHGYQDFDTPIVRQQLISKGPVMIEDQCWLGFACEILSGVHNGMHSIVAARAVVTKDVPDYTVVGGNPARILKY